MAYRTTTEQGYGADHQRERRRWQKVINQQPVPCSRAGQHYCPATPIAAGDRWELDHNADRTGWLGPAHPACNRYAGSIESEVITREW